MCSIAVAVIDTFAAIPKAVEEECAGFVDRFPAVSEPVELWAVGGEVQPVGVQRCEGGETGVESG